MRWIHSLLLRLRSLFRRNRTETELDEELRFHLERQIEQNIDARRAARPKPASRP